MTTTLHNPGNSGPPQATVSGGQVGALGRLPAIDVFRGMAIVAVVVHHLSGQAMTHASAGSTLNVGLAVLNRTLHFVVPAFVFMTALVLTRSAQRRFNLGEYYRARIRTALVPYLLWTVLYAVFRVAAGQDSPGALSDPERWRLWLQYGKGYFHLYFLLIVLQFYLVLPLLLPLWRRRPPFAAALLGAGAAQLLVFFLNRAGVLNFRFPATMALWYLLPLTLGMFFGAHEGAFEKLWHLRWRWILAAATLALAWYLPISLAELRGAPVSTLAYSAANWTYTTATTLALFGVAHALAAAPSWWSTSLSQLGKLSLQIYLLHPAALLYLERWGFPGSPGWFALVVLGDAVVAVGLPALLALLLARTPVSRWLFGR